MFGQIVSTRYYYAMRHTPRLVHTRVEIED